MWLGQPSLAHHASPLVGFDSPIMLSDIKDLRAFLVDNASLDDPYAGPSPRGSAPAVRILHIGRIAKDRFNCICGLSAALLPSRGFHQVWFEGAGLLWQVEGWIQAVWSCRGPG